MTKEKVKEDFLRDIADHVILVHSDAGITRHLSFRNKSGTWHHWFEIVTWPGCLCIRGDMGTWVFSRVEDMFTFFRHRDDELAVNLSYWAEKIQAEDRDGGTKEFSQEKARRAIAEYVDEMTGEDGEIEAVDAKQFKEEVDEEILSRMDDGERAFRQAVYDFRFTTSNGEDAYFSDFWEYDLEQYTYRYQWCCYAIVWAIMQYDKSKVAVPA